MQLMGEKERAYVREQLGTLPRPVRLVVFTRDADCQSCEALEQLAREIAEEIPEVQAERVDERDVRRAAAYGVDARPALAVQPQDVDGPTNGIRFFGFPGGYEFGSLLDAIRRVAGSDPGLGGQLRGYLGGLSEPLRLQVFVTPTCPYCPRMVQLAHRMALASPLVQADMVDATEFPELSNRFGVQGVPMTVIDGDTSIVGAVAEDQLLAALRQARGGAARQGRTG